MGKGEPPFNCSAYYKFSIGLNSDFGKNIEINNQHKYGMPVDIYQ